MSTLAVAFLVAVAAGGIAYVFLYPLLSGEKRAEKRQKALVGTGPERRTHRGVDGATNRRDQIAQSLKELDARAKAQHRVTLEQRISQAGLTWTRSKFFVVSGVFGATFGFLLLMITAEPLVALAAGFAGALGLPRWALTFLKRRRVGRFLDELPNAMDVIVRGIRSGLPLGDCLRIIASETQEPVKSEFRAIIEAQALGISIAESVAKLHERMPVPEANFFAIVIGIQQKSGGNLAEALSNLSRVLRERKKMKGKIKAMSMEAKASAAIIACLPFIVGLLTYLSSPTYVELLWTTFVGKLALGLSGCWMLVGIAVMKKMITFDF